MEWVLVLSLQWVVAGVGMTPTTTSVDFASQELCKAGAQLLKEEMTVQIEKVITHSRAYACAGNSRAPALTVFLRPPSQSGRLLPVNVLAMDFTSERVDDRYLKVLVIAQAVVTKVPCKLFLVLDSLLVVFKIDPNVVVQKNLWN